MTGDLDQMFSPERMAIVGASEDLPIFRSFYRNITTHGSEREIYLVNPNREAVRGKKCYSSVTAIEGTVDLAAILVPAPNGHCSDKV